MVVSKDKAPTAQETFMQMAQAAGLRGRLLVTVGMLLLVRLGIVIPVPGINRDALQAALSDSGLGGLLSFLDILALH
jgi:preprotein translocase subunit SecY